MRLQIKRRVNQLPQLKQLKFNMPALTLRRMENEKIEEIESIQEDATTSYLQLMGDVAKICLDIQGKAPCKFASWNLFREKK